METKICQSCGMPLNEPELTGTNADGSKNEDYCCYCFANGAFTTDCTMDEMIGTCAGFVDEFNKDSEIKYTQRGSYNHYETIFSDTKTLEKLIESCAG